MVGNRDSMWASMKPLEGLSDEQLDAVNTNDIHNGQIWHYTSIDPRTSIQAPRPIWKRVVDPLLNYDSGWIYLENVAKQLV